MARPPVIAFVYVLTIHLDATICASHPTYLPYLAGKTHFSAQCSSVGHIGLHWLLEPRYI